MGKLHPLPFYSDATAGTGHWEMSDAWRANQSRITPYQHPRVFYELSTHSRLLPLDMDTGPFDRSVLGCHGPGSECAYIWDRHSRTNKDEIVVACSLATLKKKREGCSCPYGFFWGLNAKAEALNPFDVCAAILFPVDPYSPAHFARDHPFVSRG